MDRNDGPTAPAAGRSLSRHEKGARAEDMVAEHLAALGLAVIGRNVRVGRLELDLVARDGPVVIVVEVRARGPGSWVRPLDSVDPQKRARVRRAGERLWRQRFAADPTAERMRFDIAAVELSPDGGARIELVKAAF